jgi:metal-sulfur cluster biosynthetic enzyme
MDTEIGTVESTIDLIKSNLRHVYDPEISVNIYDLGLIYDIKVDDAGHCDILMSLTSAWCPSADDITADTQRAALDVPGISTCAIKVTFDPQWGPHMMSEEAKLELNLWDIDAPRMDPWMDPMFDIQPFGDEDDEGGRFGKAQAETERKLGKG